MEPTSSTYEKAIDALGTNPALLLLALVLLGFGFLIHRFLPLLFKPFNDIAASMQKMSEDTGEMKAHLAILQKDITVIVEKLSYHDTRIKRLEDRE